MKQVLISSEEVVVDKHETGVRLESMDGELVLANICGDISNNQVECILRAINNAYNIGYQHGGNRKACEIRKVLMI